MQVRDLLALFNSSSTMAYVVENDDGKILGSVTKAQLMTKLVKNAVTLDNQIADIVIRDIRHISSHVTINELARVLARTRYALVDRKTLLTVDDLVQYMGTKFTANDTKGKSEAK